MDFASEADRKIEKLLRREKELATFGTFAFRETKLDAVLDEAARVCAECLDVPYSKICKYRASRNDLLVVAGRGWCPGVVGIGTSVADTSSPPGRAFSSRKPQVCPDIRNADDFNLPGYYSEHKIISTVHVVVAAADGPPFGILAVCSQVSDAFDEHDVNFLTGFANVLAEAVGTAARAEDLRRTVARMEELVDEKEVLSQELQHRVRNSLHLVYGLLSAELDSAHAAVSIAAFRAIALRVMGLAQVFDHLLGVGMNKTINFGEYVRALCENLPELYGQENVRLKCVTGPVLFGLDDATALGIIITELINNAYLHAFPDRQGEISVVLRVMPGQAWLSIADNGVGFVEVVNKRHGMGLVRRLVQQVGGTLSGRSDQGTTWTIAVPLKEIAVLAEA